MAAAPGLVLKLRSTLEGAHIRTSVFVGPEVGRLKCAGMLAFAVPEDVRAWRSLICPLARAGAGSGWAQVLLEHGPGLDTLAGFDEEAF